MRPIKIKPSHKGMLHQNLGIPQGQKISLKQLDRPTSDPAVQKRLTFAKNAREWNS